MVGKVGFYYSSILLQSGKGLLKELDHNGVFFGEFFRLPLLDALDVGLECALDDRKAFLFSGVFVQPFRIANDRPPSSLQNSTMRRGSDFLVNRVIKCFMDGVQTW